MKEFLFKRGGMIKKLLLFILANIFFFSYANAEDKVGVTQEVGINFPYYYMYSEPEFMYLEYDFEDDPLESYGLTYNFKNAFLLGDHLTELELDTSWQYFKQDYWSNTSGTMDDSIVQIINVRLLYGLQASDKMMLKTGFGHRYLDHQWARRTSTTGGTGYDREQIYQYIPFIAELDAPIGNNNGKLKIEYDHIFYGQIKSMVTPHIINRNDDGFMWKTSYEFAFQDFYLEPYYEFMVVEDSEWNTEGREPRNTTQEYGLKFAKKFGENELSAVADSKRFLQSDAVKLKGNEYFGDKFKFGFEYFESKLDTGLYDFTGGASLDEKGNGFSILADFEVNDFVDIGIGFTNFGQAEVKSNSGGKYKSDGRENQGKNPAGSTVSITSDNYRQTYDAYSGSLAIKPNFDLENGMFINADLGIHRWAIHEDYRFLGAGTTSMFSYADWDTFYGIGVGVKKDNFEFSVNYKDYDMYYDAEITGASLKYNF